MDESSIWNKSDQLCKCFWQAVGDEDLTVGLGDVDDTSDLHKTQLVLW